MASYHYYTCWVSLLLHSHTPPSPPTPPKDYYHPEANKTYQQTMIDVVSSVKAQGIPIQTLQFDVRVCVCVCVCGTPFSFSALT
jgi:hypothetical protein